MSQKHIVFRSTLLSIFLFTLVSIKLSGQTFTIEKIGSTYTFEEITKAFSTADMRYHRFETADNILKLDDGAEIRILSINNLKANHIFEPKMGFITAYPANYQPSVFSISNKQTILEARPMAGPKTQVAQ